MGAFSKAEAWFERHERHISTGALVVGFVVDSLTLRRVDLLAENLAFLGYILVIGSSIAVLNLYMGGKLGSRAFELAVPWVPAAMQFAIGGLMSGFVVFYSRSATFAASWPFLLLLVLMLVGNEAFKRHYVRFAFQTGVFFFALLTFSIFSVPILVGSMGPAVFMLGAAASLVVIALFLLALYARAPKLVRLGIRPAAASIAAVLASVVALYFGNVIPPIPLSLKDAGVYHRVEPAGGGYLLVREADSRCGRRVTTGRRRRRRRSRRSGSS